MYSWQKVTIFLPTRQTILTLIVVNVLIFSMASSLSYYGSNLATVDVAPSTPINEDFIEYSDRVHWIGFEDIDRDDGNIRNYNYILNIYAGSRFHQFPVLDVDMEREDSGRDYTHVEVRLLDVGPEYIWISILAETKSEPSRTTTGDFDPVYSTRQYLLQLKYTYLGAPEITGQKLMELNKDYVIRELRYLGSDMYLQFRPHTDDKFDYIGSEMLDSYITSSNLEEELSSAAEFSAHAEIIAGQLSPGDELGLKPQATLSLEDIIIDKEVHEIEYFQQPELLLVDKFDRLHFQGEVANVTEYFNIEGNESLQLNLPDYLLVEPSTNTSQYWDITPTFQEYLDFRVVVEDKSTVHIGFIAENIQNIFNRTELLRYSDDFRQDVRDQWRYQRYLQLVTIDPFNPTVDNMIQFDPELSQTEASTIKFPRPQFVSRYDLELRLEFHFAMTMRGTKLLVATALHDTEEGLRSSLKGDSDQEIYSSEGKSAVILEFDTGPAPIYNEYYILAGPDDKVPVYRGGYRGGNAQGYPGINVETVYRIDFVLIGDEVYFQTILSGKFNKFAFDYFWDIAVDQRPPQEVFS